MANITFNQLISTTDELAKNESSRIIGGNVFKTIEGVTQVAGGIFNIGTGINQVRNGVNFLKNGKPGAPPTGSPTGSNPGLTLAYQEFYSPDPFVGV